MNERIKDLIGCVIAYLVIVPVFWLIIQYGKVADKITECYYIIFRIPYRKAPDKFGYYVVRMDK